MILNSGNCHYIILGGYAQMDYINANGNETESSRNETLLGIIFDSALKFDARIKSLYRKAAHKLSAFSRINKYPSVPTCEFTYLPIGLCCPPVYLLSSIDLFSRTLNNSINCIHKRVLCLIHDNYNSSLHDILQTSNEKTIHEKDPEHLAKEMYKFVKGLSPLIMNHFFSFRDTLTTSEISSACVLTIRKLLNIEPKLLHTGDHRCGILFQKA